MKQHIDALYEELYSLRADIMNDGEALFRTWLPGIERRPFRFSALNLAYYLAVRCHDLRPVQERLLPLGLSSLGRSEARTMLTLTPSWQPWVVYVKRRKSNQLIRHKSGSFTAINC